jgi:hypothetical protein
VKIKILTVAVLMLGFACAGVATAQQSSPSPTPTPTPQPAQPKTGFRQQGFEPSPLDPLSKLVLSNEAELKAEQKPCTLGIERAPVIRGIRLGMTLSEAKALYPNISALRVRDGSGVFEAYIPEEGRSEKLKGVQYLFLDFFNDKLYYIMLSYNLDYRQEVAELAESVGLSNANYATANCEGFSATVSLYTIYLTDTRSANKVAALKENSAECQRSPVIRGVRLGMSSAQFKTLYPLARIIRKRTEVGEIVFRSTGDDARLKGISTLWTYFLDGKVYFLVVDYSSQIEWASLDQFVEQFSKTTGLRKEWDGPREDSGGADRTLLCHDFTVRAKWIGGHPRVMIAARSEVLKLTKREEQSKSPASFRP